MVKAGDGTPEFESSGSRFRLRDILAGIGLFAVTASVVLWQNAHVAVLWDTSYILDSAARFALGQMPYRHFPLVHPPLTFLMQAAIIRFTGRVFFHHVIYAAIVGGLATVLAWRIALAMLRGRVSAAWTVSLLLVAPLTVLGIYSIIPIPEYDGDCAFWILVALWLLQLAEKKGGVVRGLIAGIALCLPLFTKQNMGLPFVAASIVVIFAVFFSSVMRLGKTPARAAAVSTLLSVLAGTGTTLLAAVPVLHWTAGLRDYVYWTIIFAGERRLPKLGPMLAVFCDPLLLCTLPCIAIGLVLLIAARKSRWAQIVAFLLLTTPFLIALASLLIYDDVDSRGDSLLSLWPLLLLLAAFVAVLNLIGVRRKPSVRAFFTLIVLAAIAGTFMSQQLWGSTYAIWPLLVILIAELIAWLSPLASRAASPWFAPALTGLISVTLLVCGGFYIASEERLSYANLPDAPVEHSDFPALAGMSTPGPYLPEFDELLRYAATSIPQDDAVILLPGEDPFYFATGRVPKFPVLLFDPTTDPYSPAQIAGLAGSHNIRWLIVKRDLQMKTDPTPDRAETMRLLMADYTLAAHLRGYDVYRRSH